MRTSRTGRSLTSKILWLACALAVVAAQSLTAAAQSRSITVQVDRPGAAVPKTLFGLFFEDINFGADGGLYPERVKNRSFEFPEPLMGWKQAAPGDSKGVLQVYDHVGERDTPNSHYLRIKVDEPGKGFGATNEGFRGVGVEKGKEYTFSVLARSVGGAPSALRVEVVGADGRALGEARVSGFTPQSKRHAASLRATGTEGKARVNVLVEGVGALDVDLVSLFPAETWANRPKGLRPDLVKLLKEMNPGFLRFPGGC